MISVTRSKAFRVLFLEIHFIACTTFHIKIF